MTARILQCVSLTHLLSEAGAGTPIVPVMLHLLSPKSASKQYIVSHSGRMIVNNDDHNV